MSGKLSFSKAARAGIKVSRGEHASRPIPTPWRHQRRYGRRIAAWAKTMKR